MIVISVTINCDDCHKQLVEKYWETWGKFSNPILIEKGYQSRLILNSDPDSDPSKIILNVYEVVMC